MNAVIFFQDSIFMSAGLKDANGLGFWAAWPNLQQLMSLFETNVASHKTLLQVMVIQLVLTIVSVPLMDTAGRKVLLVTATWPANHVCKVLTVLILIFESGQ